MDDGDSGNGTAAAAAGAVCTRGDGTDAAWRYLISTPLSVLFRSDRMDELVEEPSFEADKVSSKTRAYLTVYTRQPTHTAHTRPQSIPPSPCDA